MKKKALKVIIPIVIILIILFSVLWLFTPFGFFNLKLEGEYQVKITVNNHEMYATMDNNTSSMAFKKMLKKGPKIISMRDYGNMEKVGMLWKGLPKNDKQTATEPGDIILFMGSSLVVYYDNNNWNFTKMGHINDVTKEELKEILGTGNVKMKFELVENTSNSYSNMELEESEKDINMEQIIVNVNDKELIVKLENNSSVDALLEKLNDGPITIPANDYGNMEKVGSLGFSLPTNDEQITTKAGDLILYQGNMLVLYYDTNSWNFTKLGEVTNVSENELKNILGNGNVEITLSKGRN